MKKTSVLAAFALAIGTPSVAHANNWEKFYKASPPALPPVPSSDAPETIGLDSSVDQQVIQMFENGYVPIGFSSFNSPNASTSDAVKFAAKLKARYVAIGTNLTSSDTGVLPFTTPTTTTTTNNGTVNVYGQGGSATGNYSGTSTTYGSRTTYIPFTVNRYDKIAIYYQQANPRGSGILQRDFTVQEVQLFETQRGFVVRAVRKNSAAYNANVLPGDVVLTIAGSPADQDNWNRVLSSKAGQTVSLGIVRNGERREIALLVPG